MVARGVRRAQPSPELVLEAGAQVVGQRLQGRPRPGAGDPGEDRVLAGEDVQVGRLPRVDGAAEGGERVEVRRGGVAGGAPRRRAVLGVRRLGGELATDRVAGLVEVAGHLEREPPAGRTTRHEVGRSPRWPGPTAGWRWRRGRPPGGGRAVQSRRSATSKHPAVGGAVPSRSSRGWSPGPGSWRPASGRRGAWSGCRGRSRGRRRCGVGGRDPATSSRNGRPRSSA